MKCLVSLRKKNLVSHMLLKVKNPPWEDYKTEVSSFSPLSSFVLTILCIYIIDQARGQDGWILAKFSFCVFMDRDEVEVHKNAKRERGQYPATLTELAWSIKDLLYGIGSAEKMTFVLVYFFEHWKGNQLYAKKWYA